MLLSAVSQGRIRKVKRKKEKKKAMSFIQNPSLENWIPHQLRNLIYILLTEKSKNVFYRIVALSFLFNIFAAQFPTLAFFPCGLM